MTMLVLEDAAVVCTCVPDGQDNPLGLRKNASVVFEDGKLVHVGGLEGFAVRDDAVVVDVSGKFVMPGLVDCHTHAVYGGSRANEFERRLAGESYISILEGGGGINSTVAATRAAEQGSLAALAKKRVTQMRDDCGVTTVEIKSGYGLTPEDEEKMLLAARECGDRVRVLTTFLGAHIIAPEFKDKREEYITQIVEQQLPRCAPLCEFVDVFCDRGAFTLEEARQVLEAGRALGLKVRAHAEQIESTGVAKLVAEMGGVSADHLEQLDEEGAKAMGEQGVVAVLLPGAQLYLKDVSPPVALLRKHNVKMAVATDLNPGSSPVHNLWTVATLGCILQGLTVTEAILGITHHAGLALGRTDLGRLDPSAVADAVVLSPPAGETELASLIQHMGTPRVELVVRDGAIVPRHESS